MTAAVGLERLPRPMATLLDQGAANLAAIANELDALVHGDSSALDAIARHQDNGDRIVHELITAARRSWRIGPDRAQLIALAEGVDDVVAALQTLAWSWPDPPLPELAELVLALRDAARDASRAVTAIACERQPRGWLSRCRERQDEARRLNRAARAWLLVEQNDPQRAIRGHHMLRQSDAALRACTRLLARLDTHALA